MIRILLPLALLMLTTGCVVSTVAHVATAPVRAAGWTADKLTTSQKEADRNRGRALRKQEERDRRAARHARRHDDDPGSARGQPN